MSRPSKTPKITPTCHPRLCRLTRASFILEYPNRKTLITASHLANIIRSSNYMNRQGTIPEYLPDNYVDNVSTLNAGSPDNRRFSTFDPITKAITPSGGITWKQEDFEITRQDCGFAPDKGMDHGGAIKIADDRNGKKRTWLEGLIFEKAMDNDTKNHKRRRTKSTNGNRNKNESHAVKTPNDQLDELDGEFEEDDDMGGPSGEGSSAGAVDTAA
ncbi:hypothetical protein BKA70DRAFT_1451195 [Coprinopsis sp. MPI-PUGE-AT-0042]|nr:hypothetical protein BKA70DRAFT_1451195 [Coprinopsis sp. MPI-PUGE-AT-0042]